MIHYLKNGLVLSNWVQVGTNEDWIKHRIINYDKLGGNKSTLHGFLPTPVSPPVMDMIRLMRMGPMMRGNPGTYFVTFQGDDMRYIEETYKSTYGSGQIPEKDIEHLKSTIDAFLSKIDKLLPFA